MTDVLYFLAILAVLIFIFEKGYQAGKKQGILDEARKWRERRRG